EGGCDMMDRYDKCRRLCEDGKSDIDKAVGRRTTAITNSNVLNDIIGHLLEEYGQESLPANTRMMADRIDILNKIAEGGSIQDIAKDFGIPYATAYALLMNEHNKRDFGIAQAVRAEALVEKAEKEVERAETKNEVEGAKELAKHYRWLAGKRARKELGNEKEMQQDESSEEITGIRVI